jgi:hypothetical protein
MIYICIMNLGFTLDEDYQCIGFLNSKERKQAIQDILLALDTLNHSGICTFREKIGKSFKHELDAKKYLNFYNEEINVYNISNNRSESLFHLYIDYKSLEGMLELEKYTIWLVDFSKQEAIKKDVISRLVIHQMDSEPHTVLIRSKDPEYLKKFAKIVLKDLVKPFNLKMESRYFTKYPQNTYYTIFTDTMNHCVCYSDEKSTESTSQKDYIKI